MPAPRSDPLVRAEAELTAPGAPFELEEADVLGERVRLFKRRARSLRELVVAAAGFGDAEHLVFVGAAAGGAARSVLSAAAPPDRRISFRQLVRDVAAVAAGLRARGVGPGDRVAIVAANCPEWIVTFWATVSLGAIAVGMNAWWAEAELAWALADAAPKLVVADQKRAARVQADVVIGHDFNDFLNRADIAEGLPEAAIGEDDAAVLLYTSGTTGRPKGALHSHRNLIALLGCNLFHGARMRMAYPPPPDGPGAPAPCVLVTSPLFHVSGLHNAAVVCLAAGLKSVWIQGRFQADHALAVMERERVTSWGYTQALLHRVVHHPDVTRRDLSALRQLGGGGSPIPPALQARAREVLPGARATLGVGYGQTECSSLATLNPADELSAHPESVGRPLPLCDIEIRDPEGRRLPDGEEGEVTLRGALVMLEYWRNPEATAQVIGPGRWLRSGDLGRMQDGRLTLSSRKRDLILRGGENVYPVEIEQRLELHPEVAEAAVIGVPHAELGQEVKAVIVPAAGRTPDPRALADWVAAALAYFKVPAHWELRAAPLPRNAVGKVLKHEL